MAVEKRKTDCRENDRMKEEVARGRNTCSIVRFQKNRHNTLHRCEGRKKKKLKLLEFNSKTTAVMVCSVRDHLVPMFTS